MQELGFICWIACKVVLLGLVPLFLVRGLGSFSVDLLYLFRRWLSRLLDSAPGGLPSEADLQERPEKPIAVFVPLRHGSLDGVAAIQTATRLLRYENYYLFVGVPKSASAAVEELKAFRESFPHLEVVPIRDDGHPAYFLNRIYEAVLRFEQSNRILFDVFVLHDVRSVLHPLALRYFNYYADHATVSQLPLYAISESAPIGQVFGNMLAEHYGKELLVRSWLTRCIPSPGTGTAITREALDALVETNVGTPFAEGEVLPAYEGGLRLRRLRGKKQYILARPVPASSAGVPPLRVPSGMREPVAVQERFPARLNEGIRQQARWILGTQFQAGRQPFSPAPGVIWFRLRDRLTPLFSLLALPAYAVAFYALVTCLLSLKRPDLAVPPLVAADELFFLPLVAVGALWTWRVLVRSYFVTRVHGVARGITAPLLLPLEHLLKVRATWTAWRWSRRTPREGELPVWERPGMPMDRDPQPGAGASEGDAGETTAEKAPPPKERLGDLLVKRGHVSLEELGGALQEQKETGRRLGEILVERGMLDEEDLVFALAHQNDEKAVEIDPYQTPIEVLSLVPRSLAERYRVFPLGTANETVILATDAMETGSREDELSVFLGRPVLFQWTSSVDIGFAIEKAYARVEEESTNLAERLGPRLVKGGAISEADLKRALRRQKRSHKRLGEILVEMQVITPERLEEFLNV